MCNGVYCRDARYSSGRRMKSIKREFLRGESVWGGKEKRDSYVGCKCLSNNNRKEKTEPIKKSGISQNR